MGPRFHAAAAVVVLAAVTALRHVDLPGEGPSCRDLTRSPQRLAQHTQWVEGYLRGLGELNELSAPLEPLSASDLAAWLRAFCDDNREATLADAAQQLATRDAALASGTLRGR